jgi:ATP-dependent Lhr-like helicase
MDALPPIDATELLPPNIAAWFAHRGWAPHAHQLAMLDAAGRGENALLVAPTGGGKTLGGFLPTLIDLAERPRPGLHTLYISPLKALAVDINRNLETPLAELRLAIRAETRTGDTPQARRERQRKHPPHILMTTPESLALMLSYPDAGGIFAGLKTIIIDELHAIAGTKRGDLLALGIARLRARSACPRPWPIRRGWRPICRPAAVPNRPTCGSCAGATGRTR